MVAIGFGRQFEAVRPFGGLVGGGGVPATTWMHRLLSRNP
jgi:hypothetical protein